MIVLWFCFSSCDSDLRLEGVGPKADARALTGTGLDSGGLCFGPLYIHIHIYIDMCKPPHPYPASGLFIL